MEICGDMGRFNLAFLAQNLFISSLAVVPMGAALWCVRLRCYDTLLTDQVFIFIMSYLLSAEETALRSGKTDPLTGQRPEGNGETSTQENTQEFISLWPNGGEEV